MDKQKKSILDFLVKQVPDADVPPFFAQKVAARAFLENSSLVGSLQIVARRLVPVFMALVMIASLFVIESRFEPEHPPGVELLFDHQEPEDEVTIDNILTQLGFLENSR